MGRTVPYGYWRDRNNCLNTLKQFAEENSGRLPTNATEGTRGLLGAIRRYHGGIASFREELCLSALVQEPDYSGFGEVGRLEDKRHIGKAGEYLVISDLFSQDYETMHAGECLPYDVVVFHGKKTYRIQVKTAEFPTMVNWKVDGPNGLIGRGFPAYRYKLRTGTQTKRRHLTMDECDIVACVALDLRIVAYFTLDDLVYQGHVSSSLDLRSRHIEYPGRSRGQRVRYIQDYRRFPDGN